MLLVDIRNCFSTDAADLLVELELPLLSEVVPGELMDPAFEDIRWNAYFLGGLCFGLQARDVERPGVHHLRRGGSPELAGALHAFDE